jgi:hypothetical protein
MIWNWMLKNTISASLASGKQAIFGPFHALGQPILSLRGYTLALLYYIYCPSASGLTSGLKPVRRRC